MTTKFEMTTEQTKTIYSKLLEAKKQFGSVQRKKEGYGYKYADIATICDAIDEHLETAGLGYFHRSGYEQIGETIIEYISFVVFDEQGELELSRKAFQGYHGNKSVYQDMGAASTYLRRYTMFEGFGLAVEDDDAASLTKKPVTNGLTPLQLRQKNLMSRWTAMSEEAQVEAKVLKEEQLGGTKIGDMTQKQLDVIESIIKSFATGEEKDVK